MIMTFDHAAERILSSRWSALKGQFQDEDWQMLHRVTVRTLLDFYVVLKFRKRYCEIWEEGDSGIIKLASVFPDCLQNPKILSRYTVARAEKDQVFLERFAAVLRAKTNDSLDKRIKLSLETKMFLFMNWHFPLLNPSLDQGLMVRSNENILELLASQGPPIFWELDRLKVELHSLGLTRLSPGDLKEKFSNTKLSNFFRLT